MNKFLQLTLALMLAGSLAPEPAQEYLRLDDLTSEPTILRATPGNLGEFTWWFPEGAEEYVLPISAGVRADTSQTELLSWLRGGSPWSLMELPVLGARYGEKTLVVIIPWPHYAELLVTDRLGIRFSLPEGRKEATPVEIVAARRGPDLLAVARAFREWRLETEDTGAIPPRRSLKQKTRDLLPVSRLLGAPHFYLWGPALFSRHDVRKGKWKDLAKALQSSADESFGGRIVQSFRRKEREALIELAEGEWASLNLTVSIAYAIDKRLSDYSLQELSPDIPLPEVISRNRQALMREFDEFLNPIESWGDGLSITLLNNLENSGIDRALLLLSDLYQNSPRPAVIARGDEIGYLMGPYDSYHSIHSPDAAADETWETAQFDRAAFENGRVINADGTGHSGFRGKGFHFSPLAAWPYVQERVGEIHRDAPYSAWFIDCDATAEVFDDYSETHPATRVDDLEARRQRLKWMESQFGMVVGSEGGSTLFADVIHFGHGVHTPYIGHLEPAFRDRSSPYFLGRYWPPDTPEQSFKPVPVPESILTPFFDPTVRIPLYQAALGDELLATHHWSFDSLKFSNIQPTRELLEILYMVPPLYHLNRESWPERKDTILRHFKFWSPLHRELATVPLVEFEYLSGDRRLQRTIFQHPKGPVSITVNFDKEERVGFPPLSATVDGPLILAQSEYRVPGR